MEKCGRIRVIRLRRLIWVFGGVMFDACLRNTVIKSGMIEGLFVRRRYV